MEDGPPMGQNYLVRVEVTTVCSSGHSRPAKMTSWSPARPSYKTNRHFLANR